LRYPETEVLELSRRRRLPRENRVVPRLINCECFSINRLKADFRHVGSRNASHLRSRNTRPLPRLRPINLIPQIRPFPWHVISCIPCLLTIRCRANNPNHPAPDCRYRPFAQVIAIYVPGWL
jgi:hypothetical protein